MFHTRLSLLLTLVTAVPLVVEKNKLVPPFCMVTLKLLLLLMFTEKFSTRLYGSTLMFMIASLVVMSHVVPPVS